MVVMASGGVGSAFALPSFHQPTSLAAFPRICKVAWQRHPDKMLRSLAASGVVDAGLCICTDDACHGDFMHHCLP